jgi:mRNA interferase MazF
VIFRGDIWWAILPRPVGSEPGYRRPVLILQIDQVNHSRISTVIVVSLTSNLTLADIPGNVLLNEYESGLEKQSVVNVSKISTINKKFLTDFVGRVSASTQQEVDAGVRIIMGFGKHTT